MGQYEVRDGPVSRCPRLYYEKEHTSVGWKVWCGALVIGAPPGWYVIFKALGVLVGLWE